MKKHLYLIGYMGTGKSTLGKLLSEKMNLPLLDMDKIISDRLNMSISEIFDSLGEEMFRREESDLLIEIASLDAPLIVSCGGGVVLKEENRALLKSSGTVILLTASPNEITKRLMDDESRPLLSGKLNTQSIEEMLLKRKTVYCEAADLYISTDLRAPEDVMLEIINSLSDASRA